jgi:hypothetical protein
MRDSTVDLLVREGCRVYNLQRDWDIGKAGKYVPSQVSFNQTWIRKVDPYIDEIKRGEGK